MDFWHTDYSEGVFRSLDELRHDVVCLDDIRLFDMFHDELLRVIGVYKDLLK